jgi:hypothetical protein
VRDLKSDLIDENIKGIDEWFERQNRYSRKDADYELAAEIQSLELRDVMSGDPLVRRKVVKRLAAMLPARP